jgi:transposase-like protein
MSLFTLQNKMNSKRPLSEIQPCSSPRSSARISSKKTKLEIESDTIDIPNTYRRIERLLSNGLFALISLLQQIGLLNKSMRCQDHPRVEMVICEHQKPIDGWWWKCPNLSCRRRYSIRQNSFFSRSHLSIDKLFVLAFAWFRGDSQRNAALEAEIPYVTHRGEGRGGNKTISDWFNYCRDVCREILLRKSEMIGGYGKIVELDESAFGKRKYNRGRRRKTQWVFGGIERESNKMFAVTVKNRKRRTLWPIIFKYVKPGTVILTDGWRSYMGLEGRNDYHHYTVNHTENFKDPYTGNSFN